MSHVGGSASPVLQHPRQADVHHAFITQWYKQRYSGERLQELLQETFGDITFGDERLDTLLMMVLRNATADSPWPLSNNPNGLFNGAIARTATCGCRCGSWLGRAPRRSCTFHPRRFGSAQRISSSSTAALTMYNNPAFHLFLPSPGDARTEFHATTQDDAGRTMWCNPTMTRSHSLVWQYGRPA